MIAGFTVSGLLSVFITFYTYLVLAYVVLSWFPMRQGLLMDAYRVLASLCEPYVVLFRRIVPVASVGGGGLDFSPFVALLVLQIGGGAVVAALRSAGF